jgi:deoxyribodipyrimidine photo-lyase
MHWRHGERWFWDTLVDANPANNSASWQWVAGSGSDAAPYFRVFNPVLQGQKFDPDGDYIRRYIPELAALPTEYLAHPWTAPASVLASAGIQLGITYPEPCLDLEKTRASALAAFQRMNVESV